MTEDEIVGWHHRLNGHEFRWTLGVGDGQGGLACCNSWGRTESDMTDETQQQQQQCIYVDSKLLIYPSSILSPLVTISLFSMCDL